jgi:hypothetical protein
MHFIFDLYSALRNKLTARANIHISIFLRNIFSLLSEQRSSSQDPNNSTHNLGHKNNFSTNMKSLIVIACLLCAVAAAPAPQEPAPDIDLLTVPLKNNKVSSKQTQLSDLVCIFRCCCPFKL